jgi:hypothetical protein
VSPNQEYKNGAYFKINGKPLFVVFSVHEMEHAWGGPQGVAQGWNELRAVAEEAGLRGVFVVACANPGPKNSRTNLDTLASVGYGPYSGYNWLSQPGAHPIPKVAPSDRLFRNARHLPELL